MTTDVSESRREIGMDCRQREDTGAENECIRLGIDFQYRMIDFDDIDFAKSKENRGRVAEHIDQMKRQEYADAHSSGDKFPAPVVRELPNGRLVIASGNHRIAAFLDSGDSQCLAIVCKCNDRQFHALALRLNKIEGKGLTQREVMQLAMQLAVGDTTLKDAAELVGVNINTLANFARAYNVRLHLMSLGIPEPAANKIPDSHTRVIGLTHHTPAVAKKMAQLALSDKDTSESSLRDLATHIKEFDTERQRVEYIEEQIKCCTAKQRPSRLASKASKSAQQMQSILTRLETISRKVSRWQQMGIESTEIEQYRSRWNSVSKKISTILSG